MPTSNYDDMDVEKMDIDDTPIYSPHSPQYSPNGAPGYADKSINQHRVYGEKINSLDRLTCEPIGERNVLIEQLTFRAIDDANHNYHHNNQQLHDDYKDVNNLHNTNCNDNESLNGTNAPSVAASVASGEDGNDVSMIASCGGNEIGPDYENKTASIIIIPSPTVRAYSSFAINRRSIPKLCIFCFRAYCVCHKSGIDDVTRNHYESRNYKFFGGSLEFNRGSN